MGIINVTDLINDAKESVDIRPEESSTYLERMLRLTVLDVSRKFSTMFHTEETYDSDENGIIELPADAFRIISVLFGNREAAPLGLRKKNIYQSRDISYSTEVFASAKQFKDKVEITMEPKGTYKDVKVIFQSYNAGAGNIGDQYEEVLLIGTIYRYLSYKKRHNTDLYKRMKEDYKEKIDDLTWEQNNLFPEDRVQYYWEKAWERNFNFSFLDQTRDVH